MGPTSNRPAATRFAAIRRLRRILAVGVLACVAPCLGMAAQGDPLPSWNPGAAREAILGFVVRATDRNGPDFVEPADRVAVFDQDGTLWVERPLYAQAAFALERLRALAPRHPEWRAVAPYRAAIADDRQKIADFSTLDWSLVFAATYGGMTTDAFLDLAKQWLATATHPRYGRPYTDLVYQPMREVMDHLRANGFRTYLVSGGGQDFVRIYSERVFGVPPEQVLGSSLALRYEYQNGKPVLMRVPRPLLIGEGGGKVVGIDLAVGRRPRAAFGNSEGDQEMLEWTEAGSGARLMMLVQHDDAQREYAYGPARSRSGGDVDRRGDAFTAEAVRRGWVIVSMKDDWKRLFAFDP